MIKKKNKKLFDGITILLITILFFLIGAIFGITFWKEKKVELDFKFFSQFRTIKEPNQITKGDRIVVSFSGPVRAESVMENLTIEPKLNFKSSWINNHQLQLFITDSLIPDFNYKLKIESFKSKWGMLNEDSEQVFSTDFLPEVKSIYPAEGETEKEVQEEIVFEFEEPLASQYYLKIKTEPTFEFESVKTDEENKVIIKPVNDLNFDTEYRLTVEIKSRNYLDFSQEIIKIAFKTKKSPVVIYGWNSEGVPIKTENRLNLANPRIIVGRYIDINLAEQNLYIFEDGKELGAYKVSTGIRGMKTPIGTFKIIARSIRPWSEKYGLYMPWFMQFTKEGHGIHELPEWPGGYKEGANHLGIPVSHGCVRLGIGPAKKVYDFAEIGTPIIIHY